MSSTAAVQSAGCNVRTGQVEGTNLVQETIGEQLRAGKEPLKAIELSHPMSVASIAKDLHLGTATAAKVMEVARGYGNFKVDKTPIYASVMLFPNKFGKNQQTVIVFGTTDTAGQSAWKPGQDYKGTVIDGLTGHDVMHIRAKSGDDRNFVYMSAAAPTSCN